MRFVLPAPLSVLIFASFCSTAIAQPDRVTGATFATPLRGARETRHGGHEHSARDAGRRRHSASRRQRGRCAIAANAALGLMEPTGNGIGGDIFAIVWDAKTKKLHGLNGSGRSPLGLSYDQMKAELAKLNRTTIPPHGMLPISVPGAVDGWFELHKNSASSR
jgi:gamma-glutamyltranspeptidase/glutathione hydrolase